MATVTTTIASVNNIDIGYETHGDPNSEPLLLVMGLGAQLIAWPIEMVDALVDRGFFVIRYDNRDVGLSTKLTDADGDFMTTFLQASSGQPVEVAYRLSEMAPICVSWPTLAPPTARPRAMHWRGCRSFISNRACTTS